MNRWLAVTLCLTLTSATVLSADVDSALAELKKAKASYEAAEVEYRLDVFKWFTMQEDAARSKGNKKAVDDLKVERDAFEGNGKLPKSAPSRFRNQLSNPQSNRGREFRNASKAFKKAIEEYTRVKLDKEATALEEELAEFKAARGLPPDDAAVFGKNHYKVFNVMLTWQDAKAKCGQMGGQLVIINSMKENEFVRDLAEKANVKVVWLGGTDEQKEGMWQWGDGSAFKISNWGAGQPNNAERVEHYVVLLAGKEGVWWDYPEDPNKYPNLTRHGLPGFVCEWD